MRSPDAILNAGIPSSPRKSALGSSNTVPKSVTPSSRENSRSSSHSAAESSSASRCSPYVRPKRVLVVVRRVVQRTRVQAAVVALLELDRVGPALLRRMDERLRLLDVALVVVADLRDDVRGTVPRDGPAVDDQLAHGAMVLAAAEQPGRCAWPTGAVVIVLRRGAPRLDRASRLASLAICGVGALRARSGLRGGRACRTASGTRSRSDRGRGRSRRPASSGPTPTR